MRPNKCLSAFILVGLAVCGLAFTSCSSYDEDEFLAFKSKSQIKVKYEGASTITYYSAGSTWSDGYYISYWDYDEEECHVLKQDGATFYALLYESSEGSLIPTVEWNIHASGEIKEGSNLEVYECYWEDDVPLSGWTTEEEYIRGKIYVKSIKNDFITLQFKDFVCNRIKVWRPGDSSFQKLTVNGEIKFKKED